MKSTPLAAISLAVLLLLVSASASLAQTARPGLGPSNEDPVGRPFTLPPGIILQEPIKGYHRDDCRREDEDRHDIEAGNGLYIQICLAFTNTTGAPISVQLPPGLLFVSFDDATQNGLVITVETFEIPPGDEPYFVRLRLQCANEKRDPGAYTDTFRLGPITEDPALVALLEQLGDRPLTREDTARVQRLVWQATDGSAAQTADRQWLRGGG